MVGYAFSIWMMTVACALNISVYAPPAQMDWFLYPLPAFTFARLIAIIGKECAYANCISTFESMEVEAQRCLFFLFISAIIYMVLAMYLY